MPKPSLLPLLFFFFFFILTPQTHSLSFTNLQTIHSLSHSIMVRVANLRSARGDKTGANRAWFIAVSSFELLGMVKDLNELMKAFNELTRMGTGAERVEWVVENYRGVLKSCNSLRLLKVFLRSGPLRQLVETVQKEVVEGDLLRDCLELGSNDLNGLIQVMKDVALQFSSNSDTSDL